MVYGGCVVCVVIGTVLYRYGSGAEEEKREGGASSCPSNLILFPSTASL